MDSNDMAINMNVEVVGAPNPNMTLEDLVRAWPAISGGQQANWFIRHVDIDSYCQPLGDYGIPILAWYRHPIRVMCEMLGTPGYRNPFIQANAREGDLIVDYLIGHGVLTEEAMAFFLPNSVAWRRWERTGEHLIESPLDQFSIHPILDFHIGNFYFSFTNLSLSMLLTLGLVLLLVFVVTKKGGGKSVPNAWQSLVELIYDFVPNLVNEQIGGLSGNVKQKFFPCISVTFTFSLFRNPQGMIPFSFTVTSHFLITLALSFSIFIGITIVGFQRHGLHFFSFLLPAGVPLPLAPFLVLLELISHCFRALSSGIRLFANMMAGHSSVKILSGSAWTMLFMNNLFYFIGDPGPLFIVLALTGLELGVAISQAHVSTISICIYLNDATNLHQNE